MPALVKFFDVLAAAGEGGAGLNPSTRTWRVLIAESEIPFVEGRGEAHFPQ
jgi:hypothetical protein